MTMMPSPNDGISEQLKLRPAALENVDSENESKLLKSASESGLGSIVVSRILRIFNAIVMY